FYIAIGVVIGVVVHGLLIGHLKGNAVRISERQFPEVHRMAGELAREMELDPVPAVYVLQSGGVLNAFATKFLGRSFVVVNSDDRRTPNAGSGSFSPKFSRAIPT